jgi:SAM-dependent methyltransferase
MASRARGPKKSAGNTPVAAYRDDLAYIHDVGFGGFAERAAPWLLGQLRAQGLHDGLVIDLGCGSGIWARALSAAGYGVLGYDISEAMVAIARQRVRHGEFHAKPLLAARLRPCVAVTAIGEVLNYLFDKRHTDQRLQDFFGRVYEALRPRGLFIFDVALPGRVPGGVRRAYTVGGDWACLFEAREDAQRQMVTRQITTFRKVGQSYRRHDEVHRLRLYDRDALVARLRGVGFRVRTVRDYGEARFPPGYAGFVAEKPAGRSAAGR